MADVLWVLAVLLVLVTVSGGRREEAAALLAKALERYERAGAGAWPGRVRARAWACVLARGSGRRPADG